MRKIPVLLLVLALTPAAARADSYYNSGPSGGQFSFGAEGFYDHYREPDPDVNVTDNAGYGSFTAGYSYIGQSGAFAALNGRLSAGYDDYKSGDGTAKDNPVYEGEVRLTSGLSLPFDGLAVTPYSGVGTRLFYEKGTGAVTSLGFGLYNRRIEQLYVPVGVQVPVTAGHYTITPIAEYDQLVYGRVHSDLSDFTGYNVDNNQHKGYGLRGSLMIGQPPGGPSGIGWQFGPFIRYWNVKESDTFVGPDGGQWIEPHNTRTQIGAALKLTFK